MTAPRGILSILSHSSGVYVPTRETDSLRKEWKERKERKDRKRRIDTLRGSRDVAAPARLCRCPLRPPRRCLAGPSAYPTRGGPRFALEAKGAVQFSEVLKLQGSRALTLRPA